MTDARAHNAAIVAQAQQCHCSFWDGGGPLVMGIGSARICAACAEAALELLEADLKGSGGGLDNLYSADVDPYLRLCAGVVLRDAKKADTEARTWLEGGGVRLLGEVIPVNVEPEIVLQRLTEGCDIT